MSPNDGFLRQMHLSDFEAQLSLGAIGGQVSAGQIPHGITITDLVMAGTPTGPTQAAHDNSTKIATTAYVDAAVTGGGSSSVFPGAPNPAGTFIKFGSISTFSDAGSVPVSFTTPFPNHCYGVWVNALTGGGGVGANFEMFNSAMSAGGFTTQLASGSHVAIQLQYLAIGD
jgi:hypothetical protein